MLGRTNVGSGSTGGTLTVTAPAGVTVTVSKDGKTKTRAAGASGVVTFKGLKTGTWTVTISDGTQTASKPVVITADYSTIMAFFAATINITYPAGSACTATDGTTTLTAPDTTGTWACVVPNAGTWTITTTNGEKTKSGTVAISTDGETASITLAYVLELFKDGKAVVDWSFNPRGYNVSYADSVTLDNLRSQYGEGNKNIPTFYTTSKVDITDYKTLTAKFGARTGSGEVVVGISASVPSTSVDTAPVFTASAPAYGAGDAIALSVDVSELTGEYYVVIYAHAYWAASYTTKTTDVYLV